MQAHGERRGEGRVGRVGRVGRFCRGRVGRIRARAALLLGAGRGQEGPEDPGQDVAGPGGGQPAGPRVDGEHRAGAGAGDEGGGVLEQDGGAGRLRQGAGRLGRGGLDVGAGARPSQGGQERGGLAGVRGQDVDGARVNAVGHGGGQQAQGPGVNDGGQGVARGCAQGSAQFDRPGGVGRVGARAQDEGLGAPGGGHDLGAAGQDQVRHAPGGGQAHHAGPGAHGGRAGQDRGSRVGE